MYYYTKIASVLLQLLSNFEDFNNAVCHVVKITTAESSPDVGFLTQQMFLL